MSIEHVATHNPRLGTFHEREELRTYFEERIRIEANHCWTWQGPTDTASGVPEATYDGEPHDAALLAFSAYKTALLDSEGLVAKCGNPDCVNPEHMRIAHKQGWMMGGGR